MRTKPTTPLFNTVAAAMLAFTPTTEAQASGPHITVNYPGIMGKTHSRTVDCSTIYKASNGRPYMTYEFARQVDPAGELGKISNRAPTGSERDKINQAGVLLSNVLLHFADQHKLCIAQAGNHLRMTGSTDSAVNKRYGSDWQQRSNCPLVDATRACMKALD